VTNFSSGFIIGTPERKTATARKIEDFRSLPVGWHYGGGGPISDSVISAVQELHRFLLQIGLTKTDAFAGVDGEVLLTAYHEHHYVATIVESTGEISVAHERAGTEVGSAEGLKVEEAKGHLLAIARDIWSLSVSSIHGTLTRHSEGSMTLPLRNLPVGVACQSSSSNVLRLQTA
jgi:hypothetical protein